MNTICKKGNSSNQKTFYIIYIIAFLVAFHVALPIYVESSFIESVISRFAINDIGKFVGLVFTAASLITLTVFLNVSKILRKIGNFKFAFGLIALEILSLLGLVFIQSPVILVLMFILHLTSVKLILFNIDLFLESFSNDEETGTVRGTYLTSCNVAFVIAPFTAGFILTDGDFWKLFYISAFIMVPALLLLYMRFRDYKDPVYDDVPFINTIKEIWRRKNVYKIMMSSFLLRFFYSWMVVYVPIYLNKEMGIAMMDIVGIIMPIALLPFMLFEFILGKIADEKLGEKELLTIGFIIAGIFTILLSFITSGSIIVWALMLFATRVGASFIEIMSETHFYKKIDATDTHLMGCFKTLSPLAYIIGPIVATVFLVFFDYQYLFITLGVIMIYGIRYSLTLKDTK